MTSKEDVESLAGRLAHAAEALSLLVQGDVFADVAQTLRNLQSENQHLREALAQRSQDRTFGRNL